MEGKRRIDEDMWDSQVVEQGMMINFPLVPLTLVTFPCISCYKVLSVNKKLNNHIVEMHKESASCILCYKTFERITFLIWDNFVHFPSSYTCKSCGNVFWRYS